MVSAVGGRLGFTEIRPTSRHGLGSNGVVSARKREQSRENTAGGFGQRWAVRDIHRGKMPVDHSN
jgi:hypothetical protein